MTQAIINHINKVFVNNERVGGSDLTATWAESAPQNTAVNIDINTPLYPQVNAKYLVLISNPSSVTALSVTAKIISNSFGGMTRYPALSSWSVPTQSSKAVLLEGWLLDSGGRLTLSNDIALDVGQGFTAYIRVIKV